MQTLTWQTGTQFCRQTNWDDFAGELAVYIRLMIQKGDRCLVIAWTDQARYVQFASRKDGSIDGEAASPERLTQLGWRNPKPSEPGKMNFWRRWPPPAPADAVVALAVKTLRDGFGIPMPSELEIRRGSLVSRPLTPSTRSLTPSLATGEWIPPSKNPALQLRPGLVVRSPISGRQYQVGEALGAGGFGAVYRIAQVGSRERLPGEVVLKVSVEPRGWYREAYFGDLLGEASGIVRMHEAFAWVPRGADRGPLYCLVSELIEGGDLTHYLKEHPEPWPERKARREIIRLLGAVRLVHASGAVHRDITPNNVFVAPGRELKLGDFGIALHRFGCRDVPADVFTRWFAPPAIRTGKTGRWRQADDVYHLGQLFALLLYGGGKSRLTADDAKKLSCTPQTKSVIQRSIGERRKRFANAGEMLAALERQEPEAARRIVVRSLAGKRVVFTGALSILRAEARRMVKKAGGIAEGQVSHLTDVIVRGKQSPHWKAEKKGQKLLDLDYERELGHEIAEITENRFLNLVRPKR